eukprot:4248754-Prymnesium_polylepis.1
MAPLLLDPLPSAASWTVRCSHEMLHVIDPGRFRRSSELLHKLLVDLLGVRVDAVTRACGDAFSANGQGGQGRISRAKEGSGPLGHGWASCGFPIRGELGRIERCYKRLVVQGGQPL